MDWLLFLEIKEPGFANILKNWDGPHYVVVAKSFYDLEKIRKLLFVPIDVIYYTAHFPLFPLLMILFNVGLDLFKAGLVANLVAGFFVNWVFYSIAKKYTKHPLFLTLLLTVFPARFWVTRAIIAPENLMLLLMLLSFYFWEKKQYFLTGLFGGLSVLTKIQGLFLLPAFVGETFEKLKVKSLKFKLGFLWLLLIPLAFIGLSVFYYYRVGDFFAFLRAEQGNKLYFHFPFGQFNYQNAWGGTNWLEDIVFYIIGMMVLTAALYKSQNRSWFYFSLFYTIFLLFIPQRDITRFTYPLLPFFLIQFEKFLTSKQFKIGFIFSLPALYFYTVNFVLVNQAPIADWSWILK